MAPNPGPTFGPRQQPKSGPDTARGGKRGQGRGIPEPGWLEPVLTYLLRFLACWAVSPAKWNELELVLALMLAPLAGSEAALGSGPVAALATALEAALVAAPLAGPLVVFLLGPVDMSASVPASAPVAAPALGAVNVPVVAPVAAPASVALPPSAALAAPAGALSALKRSVSVPASAALAAPGPGSVEPVAGIVAALGLPMYQAAARVSVSALVLSSGPVDGPLPAAALGVSSLWAPLS